MRKKCFLFAFWATSLAVFASCQDMNAPNLNEPDEQRVLSVPQFVQSWIAGSMANWFAIHHSWGMEALGVMADALTCSWGGYAMRDMSSEPRQGWKNSNTYIYRFVLEEPWYNCYRAISNANDGLRAIAGGLKILDRGEEVTLRARAFAKLVQGLAHGYLACFFDRAFIVDETVDLTRVNLQLSPYRDVGTAAVKMLEEAIAMMEANAFTTPESWINGVKYTNVELAAVAHSYAARYLAQVARTPAERGAVDWNKVKLHAEKGVKKAFAPLGDGRMVWWHSQQRFHNDRGATWARLDYKLIGPSDKSGKYQKWLDTSLAERLEFDMATDDKRLSGMTIKNASDENVDGGIYAGNWGASPFPRTRGTYHFSKYGYYRYEDFTMGGGVGPTPIFQPAENLLTFMWKIRYDQNFLPPRAWLDFARPSLLRRQLCAKIPRQRQ